MKGIYLGATALFTVLLLIIAFENINSVINKWVFLFFGFGQYDAFFVITIIAFIGFIIGIFLTLFVFQLLKKDDEEVGSEIF